MNIGSKFSYSEFIFALSQISMFSQNYNKDAVEY